MQRLLILPWCSWPNPAQLNPYTYAWGNPVMFSDPSGLVPGCFTDYLNGNFCPGDFAPDQVDRTIREEQYFWEEKHIYDEEMSKTDTAELDEARKVLDTSMMDVIIDAGVDILLDLIGYNDLKDCVGGGDIWACVSLAMDVIPVTKIFSVGKKLYKAGKRIFEAISGFKTAVKNAQKVIDDAAGAMKAASARAKSRIDDLKASRKSSCNSFTAAALVVMADGTSKPIAEVEVGDLVLATDVESGETGPQLVTALPRTGDEDHKVERDLVTVTIDETGDGDGDASVTATAGHAFWTADNPSGGQATWTPARGLVSGAWLKTSAGTWVQISALEAETVLTNTFNLTVAEDHTYYVVIGGIDSLTHNEACDVFRSDTRDPDEIFESGFEPRGQNMDLQEHASGYSSDSGYVSTTTDVGQAASRGGNVYTIRGVSGVDVNKAWPANPFKHEKEVAVPGSISPGCIVGCKKRDGTWVPNFGFGG